MQDLSFNKELLETKLKSLTPYCRIAFGLSCCERMLPNYVKCKSKIKWGNDRILFDTVDAIWKHITGIEMSSTEVHKYIAECESAAPDSDKFGEILTTAAQDTCFSICCILDYMLEDNVERIAQVGSYSIDTVDLYVQELNSLDATLVKSEDVIRLHPLMQFELNRQQSDIEQLLNNQNLHFIYKMWHGTQPSSLGFFLDGVA